MSLDWFDHLGFWDAVGVFLLVALMWEFFLYLIRQMGKAWRNEK